MSIMCRVFTRRKIMDKETVNVTDVKQIQMDSKGIIIGILDGNGNQVDINYEAPKPIDTFKSFNINHYVKVKLTKEGIAELKIQHNELYNQFPPVYRDKHPFVSPTVDDEGYTKFQMWDLMSSLGHTMQMAFKQGFDTEILIDMGDK